MSKSLMKSSDYKRDLNPYSQKPPMLTWIIVRNNQLLIFLGPGAVIILFYNIRRNDEMTDKAVVAPRELSCKTSSGG